MRFVDRVYAGWVGSFGGEVVMHLASSRAAQPWLNDALSLTGAQRIGAQRRGRPEGYPKDQGRPTEGRRPEGRVPAGSQSGSALARPDAGQGSQNTTGALCAPYLQGVRG